MMQKIAKTSKNFQKIIFTLFSLFLHHCGAGKIRFFRPFTGRFRPVFERFLRIFTYFCLFLACFSAFFGLFFACFRAVQAVPGRRAGAF
jgi:hypothetical protein